MSDTKHLLVEATDEVLRLTINRPEKRNALSMDLLDKIGEALNSRRDTSVKCVILSGAGDRCFAAGGDLKELDAIRTEEQTRMMSERGHAALDAIRYFPVPVIGALNGLALGGGAELAMACDLRIATAHAELGLIQSRLNVTTAWGGGIDLINAIGNSAALALLCSGRRLKADEALRLCLFEAVCDEGGDFSTFINKFIIGYTSKGLNVLRGYKATAAARRKKLQDELTATARDTFVAAWTHKDHWEAVRQMIKK
ncbi:MAG: enoyl-CoA hydratase/isomerase family protein [Gammaproteobacteria bacterium]|nr:enoyl-CoA hydratase/isomerase family protein [Gammaproteobacteria bacterium]MCP4091288.1 enoyl-CoA hydratase/isomerase family protein [Gammaproteobacteria bacterium]MCP4277687.1 enoyl-CoA hydratase/isomerase family protein [Gammaproteobacteria bacterium]MCP4833095.1 enoyl-CoA hydratase/isomerase family protein [Gammaproteobacteria bacterium]MCP4928884.1 enoyl-CoA hydratase/isomerase family protein [Gammaproteobacteria bacterium]